ncbi:MAG TPA: response regulator, partial [Phycisphaerae bacterium]|nr:response regulator [Phycisphaerae bacterium]
MKDQYQPLVLIVEDEPAIHKFLKISLQTQGCRLISSMTGGDGLLQAASHTPDVVILDLGLPDMDGIDFVRRFREWSQTPIVIISARGREQDKVAALDAGADDYLTKPFSVGELQARLRALLRRRAAIGAGDSPVFTIGELTVDLALRQVKLGEKQIRLTPNEYRILSFLIQHAGRVVTHQQLLKQIWGPDSEHEKHYLRVYINQLRQKIEPSPEQPRFILTEPGVGYRLVEA